MESVDDTVPVPHAAADDDAELADGKANRRTGQWRAIAGVIAVLTLAVLTYTRDGWIPLLSAADLGIHEFGHLAAFWAPPFVAAAAGSVMQVAVPLAFAGYFWWAPGKGRVRQPSATAICIAWAAESLHNVSIYAGDAVAQALPLFGGEGVSHDWAYLLGPQGLDALTATRAVAVAIAATSGVLFACAAALALWPLLADRAVAWRASRREQQLAIRRRQLPRRESRIRMPERDDS